MDKWANWKTIDIEQSDIQQSLWTGSIIGNLVSRHLGKGLFKLLVDRLELLLLGHQLVLKSTASVLLTSGVAVWMSLTT